MAHAGHGHEPSLREARGDRGRIRCRRAQVSLAGEDDDRYVVVACELRGTDRSLASDGLGVDAAFSREHPISARDGVL